MNALCATNKANGCETKTPGVETVARRLLDRWVVGQAQVVVRAHVNNV